MCYIYKPTAPCENFPFQNTVTPGLPYFLLGIGGALTACVCIFLPETAGLDLPHTIEEAENFGKDTDFFYIPFLHERKKKKENKMKDDVNKNNLTI